MKLLEKAYTVKSASAPSSNSALDGSRPEISKSGWISFYTVKHGYSEHANIELMLTEKWLSFPVTFLHVVNLMDIHITKCAYKEIKSAVPNTSL